MDAQDITLELLYQVALYVDYKQTREISKSELYYEKNPLLGEHPSASRTRNYFIAAGLAHAGITALLPQGKYRTLWQGITLSVEAGVVYSNYQIGIRF